MKVNLKSQDIDNKNKSLVMHVLEIEKQASGKGLISSFDVYSLMKVFYYTRDRIRERIKNKVCIVDILKTIYGVVGEIFEVSGKEPSLLMVEGLERKKLDCDLACGIYISIARELNLPIYGALVSSHAILVCKTNPFICFDTLKGSFYDKPSLEFSKINVPLSLSDKQFMSTYYNTVGVRFAEIDRHKDAIFFFDKALKCYPLDARLYYHKGVSLAHLGHYKKAVNLCKRAVNLDSSDWKARFNLGVCLAMSEEYREAVNSYNCAQRLHHKRDYRIYYHRANALLHLGQLNPAIKDYRIALRICPSDERVRSDYETAVRYSKEP